MAPGGLLHPGKTGLGSRLRRFVNSHRRGTKSEQIKLKDPLPIDHSPATVQDHPVVYQRNSVFLDAPRVRSLCVRVTVYFCEPLNYSYSRDYEGSSSLRPTEALCEALLHRFDHCTRELITRKDSAASDRTGGDGLAKPMRYSIQLQILRNEFGGETETWASRDFRSFDRLPLSSESAREIILSVHAMVGLFMRYHDEGFVWRDGPVRDDPSQEQETFQFRPGRVQPLSSIPRSYFIEKQQDFETTPGYTISLSLSSRNHLRTPSDWRDAIDVNSEQSSPLTLPAAESLFFEACYAVDSVFRSERRKFEALHKPCITSGCKNCRQTEGDGLEISLSVKNNLGPLFKSLERTIKTSINLFSQPSGKDCAEFVDKLKRALFAVRSDADGTVSGINDFDFRIIELRGRGWTLDEPLVFTLDSNYSLSQRNVVAILDRLQTGVADILRGSAIAVRMTAHKRGHFILDKTLVAREPVERPWRKKSPTAKTKGYVLDRLRQRIERDIEMICKDTFSIADREIEVPTSQIASKPSLPDTTPRTGVSLISPRELSSLDTPSESLSDDNRSPAPYLLSSESHKTEEMEEISKPITPIPVRYTTTALRDPETGLRLFPLAPEIRGTRLVRSASAGDPEVGNELYNSDQPPHSASIARPERAKSTPGIYRQDQGPQAGPRMIPRPGEEAKEATRGDSFSERVQTPSLESDGSPSARSSLLATPVLHGPMPRSGIETFQKAIHESDSGSDTRPGKATNRLKRSLIQRPASSLSSKGGEASAERDGPSIAQNEEKLMSAGSDDAPMNKMADLGLDKKEELESNNLSSSTIRIAEEPAVESTSPTKQDLPTDGSHSEPSSPEIEFFSRSKPDFDFSSPADVTSAEGSEASPPTSKVELAPFDPSLLVEEDEIPERIDSDATPRPTPNVAAAPSEPDSLENEREEEREEKEEEEEEEGRRGQNLDLPPVRPSSPPHPALQQHRKSFGSSAYLVGLRDQRRFQGIDLRRALTGGVSTTTPPPSRPASGKFETIRMESGVDSESESEPERPGTAI